MFRSFVVSVFQLRSDLAHHKYLPTVMAGNKLNPSLQEKQARDKKYPKTSKKDKPSS